LASGQTVAHYRIGAAIGAGGMGEVWQATDTHLDREVAIKVLPAAFATDAQRLARFAREAKLLASLNHPGVAHVYGFESASRPDGSAIHFLAMELVPGQDLAERLEQGAIPVEEAMGIARQVAEGLEGAHAQGIVHRDLKPANVKVTPDGKVKLLDFGLAKAWEGDAAGSSPELSHSPTLAHTGTGAGVILGTAAYMSPEQARGKAVDKRADVWAFGVLVYEMLTGRRLFAGETVSDTLAAVLRQDVDWCALPAATPRGLVALLKRCLQRDPKDRLHDIADARILLDDAATSLVDEARPALPKAKPRTGAVPWLALAAVAALAGYGVARFGSPETVAPLSFERVTYRAGHFVNARFGPDGQTVIYAAAWEGRPRELFQARPGGGGELSLGQPGADLLSVSKSGELAILLPRRGGGNPYRKAGTLAVVSMSGGIPRQLAEDVVWADWAPDGRSLAVIRETGSGRQLEYPMGTVLYKVPHPQLIWPRISPDGEKVAFFERDQDGYAVATVDRSGTRKVLSTVWQDWWNLFWAPGGDEVWFGASRQGKGSALYAVTLEGALRRLLQVPGSLEIHDVGAGGRVLVASVRDRSHMYGKGPDASREVNLAWLESSIAVDLSDDGRQLLFLERSEREGGKTGIYLRGTDGTPAVRLGDGNPQDISTDGRWVLALGEGEIVALPTAAGTLRRRAVDFSDVTAARFLPDGDHFVVVARKGDETPRFFVMDFGTEPPRPFGPATQLRTPGSYTPRPLTVSRDGRFVAWTDPAGALSVIAIGTDERRLVPGAGINDVPVGWSSDGRLFVFDDGQVPARLFLADVATGEKTLVHEIEPRDRVGTYGLYHIAVARDGQAYAYSYAQYQSDLFLVDGLR
jgi:hypothetical protein